jgi:hypothetical protein
MPHRPLLLFCFLLLSILARAQSSGPGISGRVADTSNKSRLGYTSVVLIRSSDTTLAAFTRSDSTGAFSLRAPAPGKYRVLISYPGFADYTDELDLKAEQLTELGTIPLISGTHLLQEFVLRKKVSAIVVRGDTTEYNADSFAVREGATVEELLKKLPGLQVSKDGKISAQGEQVQKILVDGEEFFSDDPAVVTKSLQAAYVDKVQVYDKKSDQAAFTGIDDGEKTKTINLTLKEDKKRGVFGKASAAAGPSLSKDRREGFFENTAMLNAFKGKRQFSAFGIMSNTGKIGLNWSERDKFGSGNNRQFDEESGMMYSTSSSSEDDLSGSWNGQYSGEGMPAVWTGGVHYADKWAGDKQHISANYRYGKNVVEANGAATTQWILPDSGYVRNQTSRSINNGERNGVDGLYEWTIDTNSNLSLTVNGNHNEKRSESSFETETKGASGTMINTSDRRTMTASASNSLNAELVFRQKFKKKGRSFIAQLRENYRASDGTGYLQAGNEYYINGILNSADSVNQRKRNTASVFGLNMGLNYTEPLSKKTFLILKYGLNFSRNNSEQLSFNGRGDNYSDVPDSVFSSSYEYQFLTHNASAALRYVHKKFNVSVGGDVFITGWNQDDVLRGTSMRRSYTNYAPAASIKYNFSKQTTLNLSYSGRTNQPTLEQLQPLRQNTDPLNVSIGNPDLRQEFRNNFNLGYNSYKPLSGQYTWVGGGGSFTQDDIVRSESFDEVGRHTYKYINTNGNYNGYFYGGYGMKIKPIDTRVNLNGNVNFSHSNTFVNGQRNASDNNSYRAGIDINKDWQQKEKDIIGISFGPSFTYNQNKSTISTFTTSYWTMNLEASFYTKLFWKMQFMTDIDLARRQKTEVFNGNNNVLLWNASINRKFLKGDRLEMRLAVSDILNQNLGYTRNGQDNFISENRYNTIRRHGLFSITYNFAKGPDAKLPGADDDDD